MTVVSLMTQVVDSEFSGCVFVRFVCFFLSFLSPSPGVCPLDSVLTLQQRNELSAANSVLSLGLFGL